MRKLLIILSITVGFSLPVLVPKGLWAAMVPQGLLMAVNALQVATANAAAPAPSEAALTGLSVDLHGATRVLNMDSTGAVIAPSVLGTHGTTLGTITTVTGGVFGGWANTAAPTAVTAGAYTVGLFSTTGQLITKPYAVSAEDLSGLITTAMTGTTSTAVTGMGAQGGSYRVYVTSCVVSNSHATVGTDLILQDGSGGTTLYTMPAAPAYGGSVVPFPNPLKTTANTALFAANVTTGSNTKLSCTGYKGL